MSDHTEPLTPADALEQAAAVVERAWTQGELARDQHDVEVRPLNPRARSFCAEGALRFVCRHDEIMVANQRCGSIVSEAFLALCDHVKALGPAVPQWANGVADWNDRQDQSAENVAREMRACAAKLRAEEPKP